jgi:hypothetical protein
MSVSFGEATKVRENINLGSLVRQQKSIEGVSAYPQKLPSSLTYGGDNILVMH